MGRIQTLASVSTAVNAASTATMAAKKTQQGNSLIIRCYASSGVPSSITDSKGHTWVASGGLDAGLFYCLDADAFEAGDVITLHGVTGSRVVIAQADEYSGLTATPFNEDQTAKFDGWSVTASNVNVADQFPGTGPTFAVHFYGGPQTQNSPWVGRSNYPTQLNKLAVCLLVGHSALTDTELTKAPLVTGQWPQGYQSISASAPIRQPGTRTVHSLWAADAKGDDVRTQAPELLLNRKTDWRLFQWNFTLAALPASRPVTLVEFYNFYKDKIQPMKLAAFIATKEQAGELVGFASQWLIQLNGFSIQTANASAKVTPIVYQPSTGGMSVKVGAQTRILPVNQGR